MKRLRGGMKRLRLWLWWIFNGYDRLDLVATRIEKLEQQNSRLAAALLAQQTRLDEEMKNLRLIVDAHGEPKTPKVKQARGWRDVQSVMAGEING